MTTTFERAGMNDFEDLVDLANYVFSHNGGRVDFPSLLPKLYNPTYRTASHHIVAKEDGKIRAIVGAFPIPVTVAGESLLACGIGTVCVHPYRRSSGYMKTLMGMAHQDMIASGADFGCLGGQRQRYQYFGYDKCGQLIHFEVNQSNVRHVYGASPAASHTFRLLSAEDPALADCMRLFAERPAHAEREPERFFDIMRSWDSQAWLVSKESEVSGYLVASKTGEEILELVLCDPAMAAAVTADWVLYRGVKQTEVILPPFDKDGIRSLSQLAETMRVEAADNMAVFRFDTTVHAFFKLKASYDPLPDGELVILVEGHSAFRMSASAGVVKAEKTEEPAHLLLSYTDALSVLFSPLGGICAAGLEDLVKAGPAGFGNRERALLRAWLPLPLFFDKADNV